MRLLNVKLYEIPKLSRDLNKILDTELFVENDYTLDKLLQSLTKDITLKSNIYKRDRLYMVSIDDIDTDPSAKGRHMFRIDKNGNFDFHYYCKG